MRVKDTSVETELNPTLNFFLTWCDGLYNTWDSEVTITSGSESAAHHGYSSLHYAIPGCAADIRSWTISGLASKNPIIAQVQHTELLKLRDKFCVFKEIPASWIDIILEADHIHIEYQPKRSSV